MQHSSFAFVLLAALTACSSSNTSGSGAAAIKACDLLTMDEVNAATGIPMGPGLLQTTATQASCDWTPIDTSQPYGVGIAVQDFDASVWQMLSSSKYATPVMGIGEEAFKGVPGAGDLSVKQGAYEVDVGIVDFTHDSATVDAASLHLMQLALPRL